MITLKTLLRYGNIIYDTEFEKDNVRIRIIKYKGILYYTEQNPKWERVMDLEKLKSCSKIKIGGYEYDGLG